MSTSYSMKISFTGNSEAVEMVQNRVSEYFSDYEMSSEPGSKTVIYAWDDTWNSAPDAVIGLIRTLKERNYVEEAEVIVSDEDEGTNRLWELLVDGSIHVYNGQVCYKAEDAAEKFGIPAELHPISEEELPEFERDLIEGFERFLEEKGIIIPNSEKDEDPNASNIYGSDYGALQQMIQDVAEAWKIVKK